MKKLFKKSTKKLKSISLKRWSLGFVSLSLLILLGLGVFWYTTEYNKKERINERRFWSAIDTALNTNSIVKTTTTGASGKQDVNQQRIFLSGERLVVVDYTTEVNNPAQSFELTINTEAQQYYDGDNYIRYTGYESSEGTSLDEYIGQWAKEDISPEMLENYKEQYVGGLVSVLPVGNLSASLRHELLQRMQDENIFQLAAEDALTREVDGETYVTIPVTISLRGYLQVLIDVFEASGYPDLGLDPESARDGTLNASYEIRTRDSVVTKVVYGSIVEEYSNYGIVERPEEPTTDLSYEELQQAVQQKLSPSN